MPDRLSCSDDEPVSDVESDDYDKDESLLFTENELIELEFLRDEEIDALVEEGLLDQRERMNEKFRDEVVIEYEEVVCLELLGTCVI